MGLDGVEIVMEVEKDFGIEVSDVDAEKTLSVAQLRDLIVKTLLAEPALIPDRLQHLVFVHLQSLLSQQMGVKRSTIKPETRFVEDLGV